MTVVLLSKVSAVAQQGSWCYFVLVFFFCLLTVTKSHFCRCKFFNLKKNSEALLCFFPSALQVSIPPLFNYGLAAVGGGTGGFLITCHWDGWALVAGVGGV